MQDEGGRSARDEGVRATRDAAAPRVRDRGECRGLHVGGSRVAVGTLLCLVIGIGVTPAWAQDRAARTAETSRLPAEQAGEPATPVVAPPFAASGSAPAAESIGQQRAVVPEPPPSYRTARTANTPHWTPPRRATGPDPYGPAQPPATTIPVPTTGPDAYQPADDASAETSRWYGLPMLVTDLILDLIVVFNAHADFHGSGSDLEAVSLLAPPVLLLVAPWFHLAQGRYGATGGSLGARLFFAVGLAAISIVDRDALANGSALGFLVGFQLIDDVLIARRPVAESSTERTTARIAPTLHASDSAWVLGASGRF